jgi:hypothetical protein
MRSLFGFALLLALSSNTVLAQERIVLRPERSGPANVELFVVRAEGNAPWQVILFVHGHQSPP